MTVVLQKSNILPNNNSSPNSDLKKAKKIVIFDDVLEEIGSFGPYQILVFVLVSMFETPVAWCMFLPVFIAITPQWTCLGDDGTSSNWSMSSLSTKYSHDQPPGLVTDATTGYDRNPEFDTGFEVIRNCEMVRNGTCGVVKFFGEYTTIVSDWELICDMEHVKALAMTVQMFGVLVGALVVGQLADIFGRRNIYYISYTLMLVGGLTSAFVDSWQLYACCRFFVGALIGGTMVVNFVLPLEMVGKRWRTFCGCIGFWACGVMSLALLAYGIRDWRHLVVVCSAVGVPIIFSYPLVPESPRWLIQKGRMAEAEQILQRMAHWNKRTMPDLSGLALNIPQVADEEEKGFWKLKMSRQYAFWNVFQSWSLARNTLIIMYAWFTSSVMYYGTSLNAGNLSGNRYVNFFLSGLVEIPALFLVIFINNRIGRKKTTAILMSVAGFSCISIFFIDLAGKTDELSSLTTAFAMLGKSGISGGWAAVQVYSAEVFPTVVRNVGVGMSSMAARVGGIAAPQIVALSTRSKPLPFIIFGFIGIICAFLCTLLPETFNAPLVDTLSTDDGCCGSCCFRRSCVITNCDQTTDPACTAAGVHSTTMPEVNERNHVAALNGVTSSCDAVSVVSSTAVALESIHEVENLKL